MQELRYDGPHQGVEFRYEDVEYEVERGGTAEVPEALAEELLQQGEEGGRFWSVTSKGRKAAEAPNEPEQE